MKLFKKSTMSLALTAAMVGGVAMTQQANAAPQMAGGAAAPAHVSVNGLGQALIYPHYTVNSGWQTNINVVNTSKTHAVAVKVRFRESENSRDVLDFNLVLSPNDKWSGYVKEAGAGVSLFTADRSCTVPAIPSSGAPFSADGYSFTNPNPAQQSFKDSGSQTAARMKEGYAEIIPMAWSDVTTDAVFAGALHNQATGNPASCGAVRNAFVPADTFGNGIAEALPVDADGVRGSGSAPIALDTDWVAIPGGENPLRGSLVLLNKEGGTAGGTNAIALANWMNGVELLTAQEFPFYLEPTLASANGLWTATGLGVTDAALTATAVINEWAENPENGADQDWVVTYPTKSFHADIESVPSGNIQAGSTAYRGLGTVATLPPFENIFAGGVSEITIAPSFYDLEEGEPVGGAGSVSFSPGSFSSSTPSLKYESNVITFGGTSVLNSAKPLNFDPVGDIKGLKSGWLNLGTLGAGSGLPTVGFAVKTRDAGSPGLSFGQIMDHSYTP